MFLLLGFIFSVLLNLRVSRVFFFLYISFGETESS